MEDGDDVEHPEGVHRQRGVRVLVDLRGELAGGEAVHAGEHAGEEVVEQREAGAVRHADALTHPRRRQLAVLCAGTEMK